MSSKKNYEDFSRSWLVAVSFAVAIRISVDFTYESFMNFVCLMGSFSVKVNVYFTDGFTFRLIEQKGSYRDIDFTEDALCKP